MIELTGSTGMQQENTADDAMKISRLPLLQTGGDGIPSADQAEALYAHLKRQPGEVRARYRFQSEDGAAFSSSQLATASTSASL